jgi:hypothetical protein
MSGHRQTHPDQDLVPGWDSFKKLIENMPGADSRKTRGAAAQGRQREYSGKI